MIKLINLKLENFMCVESADLNFENGVNLIVGKNGQGKSTILEAISLALLETKRSSSIKEYIQIGKPTADIQLSAEIYGAPFYIHISIDEKKSGMDREAEYAGQKYNTSSEVGELLTKLDLKYYANIIMSMQGDNDLTKLKPTARAEYLQRLLNFDFSDKIQKLKDQTAEIKANIDKNNDLIDFNTKSIESRKLEIKEPSPLSFTDEDINNLNSKIASLTSELSSLSQSLVEKDNLVKEKTASMSILYSTQSSIESQKHEVELIKSNQNMIDALSSKIVEYDNDTNAANTELASLNEKHAKITEELKSKEERNKVLNTELASLVNQRPELSNKVSECI